MVVVAAQADDMLTLGPVDDIELILKPKRLIVSLQR
jgi:hypothetical protein